MNLKMSSTFLGLLFLFNLFIISQNVIAQEKEIFTLDQCITEAFENNRSLKATAEKVQQAMDANKQARSDFLPKVGMTYGYTRLSETPIIRFNIPSSTTTSTTFGSVSEIPAGTQDNYRWEGNVTQPIFTGFALISAYQLSKLGIDQSETNYELGKLDLALRVKQAYFDILIADKAVEVAEKDVASRESNVNVARNFYKVGMIPVNDLLKAEVELANTQQNLIKARNGARLSRAVFNTVLSRPLDAPAEVEDILAYKPEEVSFNELLGQALSSRPEMKLIDINLLQVDEQIRLSRSKLFPEISFKYSYIKEGDTIDVSGSDFTDANHWEAMAVCSWTFWEWGKTRYAVREKEGVKKELIETKLSLEENIGLELKQAVLDMETAEENIPTTEKAVKQAEENLRVNEERYAAQVNTITDVLDAQSLLTQARVNYYRALYSYNLAKAGLMRALGSY